MWKVMVFAAVLTATLAGPVSAATACHEPRAPVAVNGGTASEARMDRALRRVKTFLKRSDDYQVCLMQRLGRLHSFAQRSHIVLDPSIADATYAMIRANQALKEKAGAGFNAAVLAFHRRCAADPAWRGCPARPPAAVEQ